MRIQNDEKQNSFGILDLCVEIDKLVGCDINFDEDYRVITLDKVEIYHGTSLDCQRILAGMYIMAVYIKGGFEELKITEEVKKENATKGNKS